MSNTNQNNIFDTFIEVINLQAPLKDLDYSKFEKHRPLLETIAKLGNSGVSIFDLSKKGHIFYSPNFGELLGFDLKQIEEKGEEFIDSKIHPEDYSLLVKNAISLLKLYFQLSIDEKLNYKLINEYRILNAENKYVKVIEQHQVLELDDNGNLWLALSIIDISPNQDVNDGLKSQLFNFKTCKIIPFLNEKENEPVGVSLSKREIEILKMVKEGLLSKEISNQLNISLNTVNKHRQRVLEKLGANNSIEAIVFASKLGLL